MSCGHIDGVRAENGPPGDGTKSDTSSGTADMFIPSWPPSIMSSSSSHSVSAETQHDGNGYSSATQRQRIMYETNSRNNLSVCKISSQWVLLFFVLHQLPFSRHTSISQFPNEFVSLICVCIFTSKHMWPAGRKGTICGIANNGDIGDFTILDIFFQEFVFVRSAIYNVQTVY